MCRGKKEADLTLFRVLRIAAYGKRNPPTTIIRHLLNEGALRRKIDRSLNGGRCSYCPVLQNGFAYIVYTRARDYTFVTLG